MTAYTIHANGTLMGTFIAATEHAALYARDAGYADYADLDDSIEGATREEMTVTKGADLSDAIAFLGATEHADGQIFSTGGNVDDDGTDDPILLTRTDVDP